MSQFLTRRRCHLRAPSTGSGTINPERVSLKAFLVRWWGTIHSRRSTMPFGLLIGEQTQYLDHLRALGFMEVHMASFANGNNFYNLFPSRKTLASHDGAMMTHQVHGTLGRLPEAENKRRCGAQQRGRESYPLNRPGSESTIAFTSWRFLSFFPEEEAVGTNVEEKREEGVTTNRISVSWYPPFIGRRSNRPKTPRIYFFDERY